MNVERPLGNAGPPDVPPSAASAAPGASVVGFSTGGELDRIAAELRALGEADLEVGDELTSIGAPYGETAVLTAFALSYPVSATAASIGVAELAPLTELARHRVWRTIDARRNAGHRVAAATEHAAPPSTSWRASFVALAMAAGLALVPMLWPQGAGHRDQGDRAKVVALSQQARAALEGLPGESDGARASSLASGYAARLSAEAGSGGIR